MRLGRTGTRKYDSTFLVVCSLIVGTKCHVNKQSNLLKGNLRLGQSVPYSDEGPGILTKLCCRIRLVGGSVIKSDVHCLNIVHRSNECFAQVAGATFAYIDSRPISKNQMILCSSNEIKLDSFVMEGTTKTKYITQSLCLDLWPGNVTKPGVNRTKTLAKAAGKMESTAYPILSYNDRTSSGRMGSCAQATKETIKRCHSQFWEIKTSVHCREW